MLPLDAKHELVMSAAAFDGHSVTTHRFRSSRSPEQLAESLRERWHAEGIRFVEITRGEWLLLSSRRESATETLQLKRTPAGSEGLHSLWQRDPAAAVGAASADPSSAITDRVRGFLPAAARPIRDIVHRDGARQAATVVATAPEPVPALSAALKRRLAAAGFVRDPALGSAQPATAAGSAPAAGETGGQALAFRRGDEEVVATVAAHRGESAIVLHWSRQR
jgi:hypothetical protein